MARRRRNKRAAAPKEAPPPEDESESTVAKVTADAVPAEVEVAVVETPTSSKGAGRPRKSSGKPATLKDGAAAKLGHPRIAAKAGPLTRVDVTCPICWSMLFKPTTLPCNHSLCEACFRKHVEETSLCCPCCRLRLSVWSRKAIKEDKLLDEELWARIQTEFPKYVDARLMGIDSQNIFDDMDNNDFSAEEFEPTPSSPSSLHNSSRAFDGVLSENPGEIRNELNEMLQQHQKDVEQNRLREETASAGLIQQLQEEEARLREFNRTAEEQDFLVAQKLQEELKTEQALLSSQPRSQPKKSPRRNLMEAWVNSSPDICELPRSAKAKTLSQQSKKSTTPVTKNTRSSTSKRTSNPKRKISATVTSGSLEVSKASQDVMSKFLSSSQSQLSQSSLNSSYVVDDNQPCSSSSIPRHDIRFSAFSPTKASQGLASIFVPSETLASFVPVPHSPIDSNVGQEYEILQHVEEPMSTTKTPDSIKSEVDRHFRPIRSAPKTPPRRRADGTFLPEPKVFRSTPIRPSTSTSAYLGSPSKKAAETSEINKSSCAILEKRISNDSGRASDDSGSPEIAGVSPTSSSSVKGGGFASSHVDQTDRSCSSEDYRVTPDDAAALKEDKSNKRGNRNATGENSHVERSPRHKKVKIEAPESISTGQRDSTEETGGAAVYDSNIVKTEPASPSRVFDISMVKQEPLKIDLACSQGIITIDEEDQDYIDLEAEALERYRLKAEQEAADRAFAETLQRSFNSDATPRGRRERYSLRSWLAPQASQERN